LDGEMRDDLISVIDIAQNHSRRKQHIFELLKRLHTEVFRAPSLDEVEARCARFFSVMPDLTSSG
jgi:hypothetical protein